MKRLLLPAVLLWLAFILPAGAEGPDDRYLQIYNLIQEGDTLSATQPSAALAKYLEAQTSLQRFQKLSPEWNPNVVHFRLNYLAAKVAEVSAKVPAAKILVPDASKPAAPGASPAPSAAAALKSQTDALQEQVRQLQNDKTVLQAKLREAFAAQPATIDPGALARSEERAKSLQKENDLLKVTVDQQGRSRRALDPIVLNQTKNELVEANRRLAEQSERANSLELEKKALQTKLDSLIPANWNTANVESTRKELEEANRKLAEQVQLSSKLASEKNALQLQLQTLSVDAQAAAALRAENEILKKQLAEYKSAPPAGKAADASRQLAEAQARIAALQSDKDILLLEKLALENRVKKMSAPAIAMATTPQPDTVRVRQLERERDDLQKKLEQAQKELYGRNSRTASARIEDLSGQLDVLRARLGVLEAQQVPYTAEELALFKRPESLAVVDARAGKKSTRELPPGSATLLAAAQRDFAAKQFDKAEEKYLEVLKMDDKNVYTLANLAAIQLELSHFDDAEKHVKRAVEVSPDDAYSYFVLGYLKFRQEKYDDAMDALSRAAKLDPQNAEVQNYLGLTLSQKGMRGPAETALRKAIQLQPNYASAHNNLAVIYATQRPPMIELARWHYQKALSAGLGRNAELEKMLGSDKVVEAAR